MISESRFAMWRGLVALVHADHRVTEEEKSFFTNRFGKLGLSAEQEEILQKDLEFKQEVGPFIEQMTDPADRSNFVYFGRLVFYSDGDFVKQEEALLKLVHGQVMSKVDLEKAMHDVDTHVADYMSDFDLAREERKNQGGFLQRFFDRLIH